MEVYEIFAVLIGRNVNYIKKKKKEKKKKEFLF